MAAHYAFNIDYHIRVRDVLIYIQECILQIEETISKKKSATYANVTTGIETFVTFS